MAGHSDLSIFVNAPPDRVWRTANDIEAWPHLFDGEYAAAEVLHRDTDRLRFRLTTAPRDGKTYSWVSERYLDPEAGTVVARRVDPGPFHYMHIFQSFRPLDGGTVLRWVQDFEARPDAPFTDEQLQARLISAGTHNLTRHKQIIEQQEGTAGPGEVRSAQAPAGHVDVRVAARAPLEQVWAVANDRTAWAHAGHPVRTPFDFGDESRFNVTTPPDPHGRSWSFQVHRIRDDERKTVFSRRYDTPDFVYSTQWFGYQEVGEHTEMRCVADFEMSPAAALDTTEMTGIMTAAMSANMTQVARSAESAGRVEVTR
ncbi:MAG: SRPBCC family protein [Pseudonocardiaceae bacterium]